MKYLMTRLALGSHPRREISEAEFSDLVSAKRGLIQILSFEEKFDLVAENYFEFEKILLDRSLENMLFRFTGWIEARGDVLAIARRLLNFLAACRLFIDHLKADSKRFDKLLPGIHAFLSSEIASRRKESRTMRTMDELRNLVQHSMLDLDAVSYSTAWENNHVPPRLRFETRVGIRISSLESDGRFDVALLNELRSLGDTLPIGILARQIVEELADLHSALREKLKPELERWRDLYSGALDEGKNLFDDGRTTGLGVVRLRSDGTFAESHAIFEGPSALIEKLATKNGHMRKLSQRYVSGGYFSEKLAPQYLSSAD